MEKWLVVLGILALSFAQVPAEYVGVDFIENVNKNLDPAIGSRIVSGWEAYPGQYPWQVSLRMVDAAGGVSSCGGSIVHRGYVITAAHCTAMRLTIVVRAGVTNLTTPVYISETTTWYNHPNYNSLQPSIVQPDDISLLKLTVNLSFRNRLLQPIRVQSLSDAYRNYDQELMIASGFGRTWTGGELPEVLNWVYLVGVANTACFGVFGGIITQTTVCAGYFNVTSQSTCQGDSGGPLVHIDRDGIPVLVGVASFVAGGEFGCHSGFPAGFCRVGPFLPWFKQMSGIDFENLEEDSSEESSEEDKSNENKSSESSEGNSSEDSNGSGEGNGSGSNESNGSGEGKDSSEGNGSGEGQGSDEDGDKDSSGSDDKGDSTEIKCNDRCSQLLKKLDVKVKVHVKLRS